jgi:outer membrane protein
MKSASRCILGAAIIVLSTTGFSQGLDAQDTEPLKMTAPEYGNTRWFPTFWNPYTTPRVPEQKMSNSERLHSLIRDGKLRLSVEGAIALALENNMDIVIARAQPAFAKTDILRAKGGGAARGVQGAFQSSALYSGAIGGGVSGFSGSSTSSAGGVTGGGGATDVGSIGCCDPTAGVSFGWDRRVSPLNYIVVSGLPVVTNQTTNISTYFGQGFLTGTSYAVGISGYRQSTTSLNTLFNPAVPTGLTLGFHQKLLNGFGYRANAKFIRIAKNNAKIADSAFRQQVITTIAQTLNLYWDLLVYQENVRVAEQSLTLAQKLLSDNMKQVEIGTLAPIEVVRAKAEVAARQQDLIVAQTNLRQQQELLKAVISKQVDKQLASVTVDPTDTLPEPKPDDVPPLDEALQLAASNRPEIEQAELNLRNQAITIKANRNALLPSLDIFATYAPTGLSGNQLIDGSVIPAGWTDSLSGVFKGNYPDYSFGFNLQIPIRNRQAQADAARALVEQRQLEAQLQKAKNDIAQQVRNAEIALTQAKAQIEAAREAVSLARQTFDAEQKKFRLGESTVFLVIQAQRDLTTAEGNEVKARSAYAKALTQFAQATGTVLAKYHVEMTDALEGRVSRTPIIPGTQEKPATEKPFPQG